MRPSRRSRITRAVVCLIGLSESCYTNAARLPAQDIASSQSPTAAIVKRVEVSSSASSQAEWLATPSAYLPLESAAITIKKFVGEVTLVLSVVDRKGHFVENLRASELAILDNDQKQDALTFFQSQTDLPLRVALLIDMSSSVSYRFEAEQAMIRSFFREVIRPTDAAALFAFNQNVELVVPIADNWKQISRRMRKLRADGETAIYDATAVASEWLEEESGPARRLLILVTDGQENTSKITIDEAISRVLIAGGSIYTVNIGKSDGSAEDKRDEAILRRLSDATGGNHVRADQDGNVGNAFSKIKRELRSQYAIAYKPSNLTENGFHRVQVIAPNNLRVRCRTGYYTK